LKDRERTFLGQKKEINEQIVARAGASLTNLDQRIIEAEKAAKKGDAFGYHSAIESEQSATKWVQVDIGRSVTLTNIVLHPCKDDFNNIGEGFGFPIRFKVETSQDANFTTTSVVADRTAEDVPNPKLTAQSFDA